MQVLQRWRSISIFKNTIIQSTTATSAAATTHSASFYSKKAFSGNWKKQFNSDVRGDQKPSKVDKQTIRCVVREKRRNAKRALNGILYSGGCSTPKAEIFSKIESGYSDRLRKKTRIKPAHHSKKVLDKKLRRERRREKMFEDSDYDPRKIFYATFGKYGFRTSGMGFDWTENSGWSKDGFGEQDAKSGTGSHPFIVQTDADRKTLGLPTTGPLKIEDVKAAFRSSALKWHPDRHQDSSQAAAEEKFKQCVDAYKSLCSTFSKP